jgi:Ca2+-transporting ATPase
VARAVGLTGEALDGAAARSLLATDPARLRDVAVVSRVTPADKVALVRALAEAGEVVAMAGDGINDAAALKAAHVGIAVGLGASDLARSVADVVLTSPDLRSILRAVGEGRIVQDDLRRALRFLFATNLSEVALVIGAALVGAREPLTPLALLWINLLTDTLPALALALEPGHPDVLDRPPAPPHAPLLSRATERAIVRDGLLVGAVGAAGYLVGGPPTAFGALVGAQLGYAGVCRAPGAPRARSYAGLVGTAMALEAGALVFRPLRGLLGLGAPSLLEVAAFGAAAVLPALVRGARGGEVIVRRATAPVVEATAARTTGG